MSKKAPDASSQKSEARSRKKKPFYALKPPKSRDASQRPPQPQGRAALPRGQAGQQPGPTNHIGHPISSSHFELRDDGRIAPLGVPPSGGPDRLKPELQTAPSTLDARHSTASTPRLTYHDTSRGIWLYHGNCLELLDAIYAKYGDEGRFDCIFADPPYFLSNGGITCHAGKMVKVDKGDWDVSRGPALNHEFNTEWLARCQRVLKPNGTIWVTGTHHVIFSIGYALQQLGYKILNDIAWEKPNPPPNLSCRYFTHSTETILWAAKNAKSKHTFNYQEMRKETGKQMKTVWRRDEFTAEAQRRGEEQFEGRAELPLRQAAQQRGPTEEQIDLAIFSDSINGSRDMPDVPEIQTERIFHETKFVFLSCCAGLSRHSGATADAVVHTTVDVSLQEAWAKTPTGKKRETTHIVRCETEIFQTSSTSFESLTFSA